MTIRNLGWIVLLAISTLICVTVLLALHIDPTPIIATISVIVVPIIGAVLYGKVSEISQNTNGNTTRLMNLLEGTIEHLKTHNSILSPTEPPKES